MTLGDVRPSIWSFWHKELEVEELLWNEIFEEFLRGFREDINRFARSSVCEHYLIVAEFAAGFARTERENEHLRIGESG